MFQIEKDSESTVGGLNKIDHLKTVLENTKQALHEADNWSVLASDIEEVSDSGFLRKHVRDKM